MSPGDKPTKLIFSSTRFSLCRSLSSAVRLSSLSTEWTLPPKCLCPNNAKKGPPRSVRGRVGRLESHRIVAHMTSSDDIIFSNLSDGLLDGEGNYRNCEEPLHSGLLVLASCLLRVVLLATANAPGAAAHAGVLGRQALGNAAFHDLCKVVP